MQILDELERLLDEVAKEQDQPTPGNFVGPTRWLMLAHAAVNTLPALIRAARAVRCLRFTMQPCRERPEIEPGEWCEGCSALAALDGEADG